MLYTLMCHNVFKSKYGSYVTTEFCYKTREKAEDHLRLCLNTDDTIHCEIVEEEETSNMND